MGLYGLDIYLVELLDEKLPVLSVNDRLHRGTQHLHTVLFQCTGLVQFHPAVQGSLPAECQENPLGSLLFNDLLDEERGHREEIDLVRHTLRSLDGGDVRVYQDCLYPFFLQSFKSLGTGVVELSGLSDFERTGPQNHDFLYVVVNHCLQDLKFGYEFVEKELRVSRSAGGLGMELRGEERPGLVAYAFVGTVVHIYEKRLPVSPQSGVVHGKAMVL